MISLDLWSHIAHYTNNNDILNIMLTCKSILITLCNTPINTHYVCINNYPKYLVHNLKYIKVYPISQKVNIIDRMMNDFTNQDATGRFHNISFIKDTLPIKTDDLKEIGDYIFHEASFDTMYKLMYNPILSHHTEYLDFRNINRFRFDAKDRLHILKSQYESKLF